MKVIDLGSTKESFEIGCGTCEYSMTQSDRVQFFQTLSTLSIKEDNTEKLRQVFQDLLRRENPLVVVQKDDVFGLFHFFLSRYL